VADKAVPPVGVDGCWAARGKEQEVGQKGDIQPMKILFFFFFLSFLSIFFLIFFISKFSLNSNLNSNCAKFFLYYFCEVKNTNFRNIIILFIFLYHFSSSYFQNPNFNLGFNSTFKNY
jgi:hypothetical protein